MSDPKPKRASFKRQEVILLSRLVEAATITAGTALVYRDGHSDQTVAEEAGKKLSRQLAPSDIAAFRKSAGLKLASEGRPSHEMIDTLVRSHEALVVKVHKLEQRLVRVEEWLKGEDEKPHQQPRTGNGFHPPRPTAASR